MSKTVRSILSTLIVALTISFSYLACGAGGPTGGFVSALSLTAGGGLTLAGTGPQGAVTIGMITSCTSGQSLTWSGTAWICTTVSGGGLSSVTANAPITGLGTSGSPLGLSLTTTSCGAGSGVSAIGATGVGTCTADVTAATGVSPISVVTSSGTATSSLVGCTSGQGYVDLSGTWTCQNYLSSGLAPIVLVGDTIELSLTPTTCAAGKFVDAIDASGNGTCATPAGGGSVSITAGTGLSASPATITGTGSLSLAITPTSCSAGSAETATSSAGVGTCSAVVSTITGTAPIVASTVAGAAAVSLSLTPTTCAAGKAETATSATGVGTCTTFVNAAGSNLSLTGSTLALVNSPSVSGSLTAATGVTSSGGNITATAGSVSAGTTVTSGTDVLAGRDSSSARFFVTTGASPVNSSCGGGATIVGTDVAGRLVLPGSVSLCTVTWGQTHSVAPEACVVSAQTTGVTDLWVTQNIFGMTVHGTGTFGTAGTVVSYICMN